MEAKKLIGIFALILMMISTIGYAQESSCEHSIWAMDCLGIKTYCPECQESAKFFGTELCSSCSGKGKIKCYSCNGIGRKTCSYCSGTGRRLGSECNYCGGKITMGCLNCLASGYEYCFSCKGAGKNIVSSNNECLICGTTPVCCEYYAFHNYECPICSQDAYTIFEYKNVVRNVKQYIGNPYCVSGVVDSVSKIDEETYELRIKHSAFFTKEYYNILYRKTDTSPILLVGDSATLFGVFTGVNSEMEPLLVAAYSVLSK